MWSCSLHDTKGTVIARSDWRDFAPYYREPRRARGRRRADDQFPVNSLFSQLTAKISAKKTSLNEVGPGQPLIRKVLFFWRTDLHQRRSTPRFVGVVFCFQPFRGSAHVFRSSFGVAHQTSLRSMTTTMSCSDSPLPTGRRIAYSGNQSRPSRTMLFCRPLRMGFPALRPRRQNS